MFISKATIHVYNRSSVVIQRSVDQEWLVLGMGTPRPQWRGDWRESLPRFEKNKKWKTKNDTLPQQYIQIRWVYCWGQHISVSISDIKRADSIRKINFWNAHSNVKIGAKFLDIYIDLKFVWFLRKGVGICKGWQTLRPMVC